MTTTPPTAAGASAVTARAIHGADGITIEIRGHGFVGFIECDGKSANGAISYGGDFVSWFDSPPSPAQTGEERAGDNPLNYATRLATTLWEKHYKETAPDWTPLTDLLLVLTQIDNMCSGLWRKPSPEDAAGHCTQCSGYGWLGGHVRCQICNGSGLTHAERHKRIMAEFAAQKEAPPSPEDDALRQQLGDMKRRAQRAHQVCNDLRLAYPDISELGDEGVLHNAIHDILRVDTPEADDATVRVPRELTAENGAKAALMGELFETTTDSRGKTLHTAISWTTIKAIYKAAIKHFAESGE